MKLTSVRQILIAPCQEVLFSVAYRGSLHCEKAWCYNGRQAMVLADAIINEETAKGRLGAEPVATDWLGPICVDLLLEKKLPVFETPGSSACTDVARLLVTRYYKVRTGQISSLRLTSCVDRLYGSAALGSKYCEDSLKGS